MFCRIAELHCKEVINVCTGFRLGYVSDAELDTKDGRVTALIVPGPYRFFGLLGHEDDFYLPWGCIERIGKDIILVNIPGECQRCKPNRKRKWF